MTHLAPIDFWFSIGSLYTYLSVMRIDRIEELDGVAFRWRPFNVRAIMAEMDNRPASKPVKAAYLWRDLERRASKQHVDFNGRPPYPLKEFDLANRIAVVAADEGWCDDYARATYARWFGLNEEAGSEPNVSNSLREIGQDPARALALAQSDAVGRAYDAATDEARGLGIFGAPTFAVNGELFWGDDRLEDAVRWLKAGTLKRR
ncbi:MAG: 2-hydroxychromene-2-carboxylate isomerase [Alphaproteobacteria bacterium]|nr:2-hydroxychromene-2-carboxylate isomerase [Alphaproteobacteria bacterium]